MNPAHLTRQPSKAALKALDAGVLPDPRPRWRLRPNRYAPSAWKPTWKVERRRERG